MVFFKFTENILCFFLERLFKLLYYCAKSLENVRKTFDILNVFQKSNKQQPQIY
jgi:hypothetical protein